MYKAKRASPRWQHHPQGEIQPRLLWQSAELLRNQPAEHPHVVLSAVPVLQLAGHLTHHAALAHPPHPHGSFLTWLQSQLLLKFFSLLSAQHPAWQWSQPHNIRPDGGAGDAPRAALPRIPAAEFWIGKAGKQHHRLCGVISLLRRLQSLSLPASSITAALEARNNLSGMQHLPYRPGSMYLWAAASAEQSLPATQEHPPPVLRRRARGLSHRGRKQKVPTGPRRLTLGMGSHTPPQTGCQRQFAAMHQP